MNRNPFWKSALVVFVVAWALYELYPPTPQNVIEHFERRAVNTDSNFTSILERANALAQVAPDRRFGSLKDAVGTNDITKYFPFFPTAEEKNPSQACLNHVQREAAGKIRLGIDLQGGTSFMVRMGTNDTVLSTNEVARTQQREAMLFQAVEVLRKRVDRLGVAEPIIQPSGTDRILIQLPGLSQAEMDSARNQIQKAAFLEFRMLHEDSDRLVAEGLVPPGYEILTEERVDANATKRLYRHLVSKKAERGLTGKYISRAMMTRDPVTNEPEINFELDNEGAALFGQITTDFKPVNTPQGQRYRFLAIVLDGELYSAPRIMGPIMGGRGVITGSFTAKEAYELANILENPLEAPLSIEDERTVSPSLGEDSIRSGINAAKYGVIAVAIFMGGYYLLGGMIANFALALNIIILMGAMCSIQATLTMPGIAGIVLTIGMAVDANVLIFERMREELQLGKSLRGAISAGYDKAFGTILDSNVTTLISALILYFMGTGPVQGFGLTLAIGIVTSMFTALVVTRLLIDFLVERNLIKSMPMLNFLGKTNIDFLKWALPAFICTWILIVVGIGYGFKRGGGVMGVDFAGGDSLRLAFKERVGVDQVREKIEALNLGSPTIQYQKDLGTGEENLLVTTAFQTGLKVEEALKATYPKAEYTRLALETVGPVVGAEILRTGIISTLLAFFGILVYVAFRFELSFAVASVLALVHDVLMTLGVFFLSGRELNAPVVAAVLTIIGFSINDTIVIFDRIREDLKLGVRGSFKEIMNIAINQTLGRTIITSGTTFLAALSLYFFGGGVINDFAFTFLVGVISGSYSTIYIASYFVLVWHKGERPRASAQVIMDQPAAALKN